MLRNDERLRYELLVGDELAGYSAYRESDGSAGGRTIFIHTEIDPAFGGRGLGSVLVRSALDDVVQRSRVIVPICPFVAKLLRTTSEYDGSVEWPEESPDE